MFPPVFQLCVSNDQVKAILGTNPTRLYLFGEADENTEYPFAVWQLINGDPNNTLNCRPSSDNYTVQIDCYAHTAKEARALAKAIRDALEGDAYVTRWNGEFRDSETKDYRYSFDVDFITYR